MSSVRGFLSRAAFQPVADKFAALGDWSLFAWRTLSGMVRGGYRWRELLRVSVELGVASVGVIAVTGLFIGMVLAVQAYGQFHIIGMETSLGAVIHMSLVRELGPVLAAVMLSGRVGSAMAAELATMNVTEQLDALACLGVDPVKYLAAPRVLACLVLTPLLTVLADLMGVLGSTLICLQVYEIDSYHYWRHTREFVKDWDLLTGLLKSVVFGGVLSLIACHRGFNSRPGAEGVGKAATEAFVMSFVVILVVDFFMALFFNTLYSQLWPTYNPHVAESMADTPIIEFRAVGMRFDRQQVLTGIDFAVRPRETVCVIGESGCGKTVLLKLIVGLLRPTEGEVLVEGVRLQTLSEAELTRARLRLGFLFQSSALFDSLTVFDNVAFGLRAKGGVSEYDIANCVRERLRDVGMPSSAENKMPAELSGGMRKRVGLARSLALDPEVMLYDEPTTGLDPIMSDAINELILQTRQSRPVTSIIVTHEMRTVRKCADRVVMLSPLSRLGPDERQILFDGPPDGLATAAVTRVRQFVEGDARTA